VRFSFTRAHRLNRSADIERVRKSGRSWAIGPLVIYAAPGPQAGAPTRIAFVAGKKLGDSVERNQAKRWMREAFRLQLPYIKQGWDLLLIARPSLRQADFRRVQAALADGLKKAQLYEDPGPGGNPPLPAHD
jgi:ribonuclease P protein component